MRRRKKKNMIGSVENSLKLDSLEPCFAKNNVGTRSGGLHRIMPVGENQNMTF